MKNILAFILICLLFGTTSWSQIGIGTKEPKETLHVNGTVRIEGSDDSNDTTGLIGADADGTLTSLNLDNSLSISNNTLNLTREYVWEIGDKDLSAAPIVSGELADLDLKMGPGEINEGKTVINVFGLPSNPKLTGIQDGVNGLHLFLYHIDPSATIQVLDESNGLNSSILTNRIKVLSNNETLSGKGCIELIYDGTSQRWLFLSIHD